MQNGRLFDAIWAGLGMYYVLPRSLTLSPPMMVLMATLLSSSVNFFGLTTKNGSAVSANGDVLLVPGSVIMRGSVSAWYRSKEMLIFL